MREAVCRSLTTSVALLLPLVTPAFAGGGDPDDRPAALSSASPGDAVNSPGAAPG